MRSIKTTALICSCLFILGLSVKAQPVLDKGLSRNKLVWNGQGMIDTTNATPDQMYHLHIMQKAKLMGNDHYYYVYPYYHNIGIRFNGGEKNSSQVYEGLPWGHEFRYKSIIIDGDCPVEFSGLYITEKNAGDFLYHVIENDRREVVSWTTPSVFKYTADHKAVYAYLGKFEYAEGRRLKIEVYNKKEFRQYDAMLVDWAKIEPAKVYGNIEYTIKKRPLPGNSLFSYGLTELKNSRQTFGRVVKGKVVPHDTVIVQDFSETMNPKEPKFRLADSIKNLSFDIKNGGRSYLYVISLKRTVDGHTDSINLGEKNSRFSVYKEFWKYPGVYQVTFTPVVHKHGGEPVIFLRNLATNVHFTVLPALDSVHMISFRTLMLIIVIILTTGGFMFMMYRDQQKRKLAAEAKNKQIATLQLASVRAQLNPHFIFNALAGIQNLMNKNDVENANKYLARFARLTRNVLDDGNKELVSIEHEISLLNDYLLMEQTRFGFEFNIVADENQVDQQIEIPAMLLQPFVENAVKHGVSALNGDGMIEVIITQKDSTLILAVNDNGKGFGDSNGAGMGLKLCEDRIKLLNSIYKNSTILLHKTSDSKGTLITIELRNWV
ncbi:histidine kinase [Mucilaginibacter mali]|uniref:Histidine kinase n=1 Tax=Mucilaginibacter mali TaxID=2740462 RepID=A0A7D4QIG4_9SPHI|nr:histidine kinase [Mucilaginibacter mali]QKJ32732.1 histidine kinase [Mucilaginibacter mali]